MYRIGVVLAFAAAPLMAQQASVRPLPEPAPFPMPAIAPVEVAIARPSINVNVQAATIAYSQAFASAYGYDSRAPQAWAPQDPADSLYRQAQQAMNRGDYRRAASLFKDLPAKQPNSVYAS